MYTKQAFFRSHINETCLPTCSAKTVTPTSQNHFRVKANPIQDCLVTIFNFNNRAQLLLTNVNENE